MHTSSKPTSKYVVRNDPTKTKPMLIRNQSICGRYIQLSKTHLSTPGHCVKENKTNCVTIYSIYLEANVE